MIETSTIRRLIKTAKKSDVQCKVAAIAISQSGEVITHASNRVIRGSKKKRTYHAEESIILKLKRLRAFSRYRGKITIMVLRIGKDGSLKMAKPCSDCQSILEPYIDKRHTWFTKYDGTIGRLSE